MILERTPTGWRLTEAEARKLAEAKRRDDANAAGLCYCDAAHCCGAHSRAFHAAYAEMVAGRRPDLARLRSGAKMLERVCAETPVAVAPPARPWQEFVA